MRFKLLAAAAMSAGCCACVSLRGPASEVVVTPSHEMVASCTRLGGVNLTSPPIDNNEAIFDLQKQALAIGGNTLLMRAYLQRFGTAYKCDPPLDPNGPRVQPTQTGLPEQK